MTINNGAIVGKDIVDQSLDLCPAGFQDLIKKRVPEKGKESLIYLVLNSIFLFFYFDENV